MPSGYPTHIADRTRVWPGRWGTTDPDGALLGPVLRERFELSLISS